MVYGGKSWPLLKERSQISETGKITPTKIHMLQPELFELILFYAPLIVHGPKLNFGRLQKEAKFMKPERPCPLKLVCKHVTSASTCTNFLS